ncbi:MAG: family 78 glycoside hydrolase catalytic domain [Lachnospiraceae bacterium]|nr:family 78 glycoside hydrolase catalytic domain [Lachnospiraceae bacterium]
MIGEKYDARFEDGQEWKQARVVEGPYAILQAPCTEPVRPVQVVPVAAVLISPRGERILDFGQNLVGVVELEVSGPSGTEISLEYSEVLTKEGNFENFIDGFNRDQTDYYILKGAYQETYRPRFTFHGFRYVKVGGYPGELRPECFRAVVIGSDCAITNEFWTSDQRLNRLQSNILWSQRGNLLSIPTDCPQRERAGWTGDVWVYGETCCINQDCRNFFRRWLRNLRKEQFESGLVPIVIPYIKAYRALQVKSFGTHTSAGWGDVIVALPWYLYEIYGDISVLEENYEAMERWMEYVRQEAETGVNMREGASEKDRERQKFLWNTNFHYGDWLYPSCRTASGEADMFASANTTKEYVATAIYAYSAKLMENICQALGKKKRSSYYRELNGHIREAFAAEYITDEGRMDRELQGVYVMALAMELVPQDQRPFMAKRLEQLIRENHGCLDTGFMSIRFLMDVLVDNGLLDTANTVLYQEACPSWLYEVKKGATTIWETWNGIHEDDERGRFSYNHYAFGCIGDWMYRTLLGIRPLSPGYRRVLISPDLKFGLEAAEGAFESVYGKIQVKWRKEQKGAVRLAIRIPANVTACVQLPGQEMTEIGNGEFEFTC